MTYIYSGYQLLKSEAICNKDKYDNYFGGYQPSVDACYQSCKGEKFFHIYTRGSHCKSDGCYCTCYKTEDSSGGCETKFSPNIDLYLIDGKLANPILAYNATSRIEYVTLEVIDLLISLMLRYYKLNKFRL